MATTSATMKKTSKFKSYSNFRPCKKKMETDTIQMLNRNYSEIHTGVPQKSINSRMASLPRYPILI